MRLALIQTKQNALYGFAAPERRFAMDEAELLQQEMLRQNLTLMQEAAEKGCDLIVTTEAINFAGQPQKVAGDYPALIRRTQSGLLAELSRLAREGRCWIAAGMYLEEDGYLYNTIHLFDREGQLRAVYRKTHLAGEEKTYLTPGEHLTVVDTDLGCLGLAICWDMQFPETCQLLSAAGAELIIAPTWGWEYLYGPARAYENGVFVAATMAVPWCEPIDGIRSPSQVIDHEGRVLAQGGRERAEIVWCDLPNLSACHEARRLRLEDRRGVLPVQMI